MKRVTVPMIVVLLFAVQNAKAQTVDEIMKKSIEVRGGVEKFRAVKTICKQGSFKDTMDYGGSVRFTMVENELDRVDFIFFGRMGFRTKIKNKETGLNEFYQLLPFMMKRPNKTPGTTTKDFCSPINIFTKVLCNENREYKGELLGKDSVDQKQCYTIKLMGTDSIESIYWIDVSTYLLTQTQAIGIITDSGYKKLDDEPVYLYSNYRLVNGLMLPYTETTLYKKAGKVEACYYNSIKINEPIDPALYKPKALKHL